MTNKSQTTNTTTAQSKVTFTKPAQPTQPTHSLGETFVHNGRSVQVVEIQAEGIYHVKATEVPFDSYWLNTGEAADITNASGSK